MGIIDGKVPPSPLSRGVGGNLHTPSEQVRRRLSSTRDVRSSMNGTRLCPRCKWWHTVANARVFEMALATVMDPLRCQFPCRFVLWFSEAAKSVHALARPRASSAIS
jgi:hypothetical protein